MTLPVQEYKKSYLLNARFFYLKFSFQSQACQNSKFRNSNLSDRKTNQIRELEQEIDSEGQFEIKAKYNLEKNQTKTKTEVSEKEESEKTFPGLVIIKLVTAAGKLNLIQQ